MCISENECNGCCCCCGTCSQNIGMWVRGFFVFCSASLHLLLPCPFFPPTQTLMFSRFSLGFAFCWWEVSSLKWGFWRFLCCFCCWWCCSDCCRPYCLPFLNPFVFCVSNLSFLGFTTIDLTRRTLKEEGASMGLHISECKGCCCWTCTLKLCKSRHCLFLCFPAMYSWPALFPIVIFSTLFGFCILLRKKNVFLRN